MAAQLTTLTLNTHQLDLMLQFYKAIGFEFKAAKVEKGGQIYKSSMDGFELSICGVGRAAQTGVPVMQLGFTVGDVDLASKAASEVESATLILEPMNFGTKKQSMLLDPDGNAIELSQNI